MDNKEVKKIEYDKRNTPLFPMYKQRFKSERQIHIRLGELNRTRYSTALDHGATQVGNEGVHIPFEAM